MNITSNVQTSRVRRKYCTFCQNYNFSLQKLSIHGQSIVVKASPHTQLFLWFGRAARTERLTSDFYKLEPTVISTMLPHTRQLRRLCVDSHCSSGIHFVLTLLPTFMEVISFLIHDSDLELDIAMVEPIVVPRLPALRKIVIGSHVVSRCYWRCSDRVMN